MTDVVGSVRSLSGEALLEECAVTRAELPPNCGVFLGIELRDQLRLGEGSAARRLAGELRVAGPAEVIDAGATSEAAALARARRALLDRECDAAIAGGAESLTLLAPEGWRASLDPVPGDDDRSAAQLLVLSAKDARSLAAQASRLAAWLDAHRQVSLRDVAWTLQCGREAMEHRIAFVVTSVDDARSKLLAAAPAGNVASIGDLFGNEPDDLNYLRTLWAAGKLERVARFWTAGAPVPWKALGHCGRRITGLGAQASPVPMLSDIQRSYLVGREAPLFGGTSCYLCWELEHRGWDLPRLEAAWNKLVARHEMLRTVFTAGAVPRVLDDVPHYALEVFDWRDDANAAARLAELREQSMQAENVPSQWPLFRISVAILPQAMHLFFGIDLAVADGRSVLLLLRELGELYDDPLKEAPPPPVGFRDHLASLHARKATASHREHVEYWTKRLDEIPPAPDLPTTGAVIERSHFRRIDHRISREAWQAIQGHAAKRGLSKVSVFLAAFSEVLGRWASRSDFTLNLTAARREAVHPAMDDVVGDFTTNVLLAVDCRERVSFAARVRAVKEQLARDLEHVDFGGVEVIAALSKRKRESVLMPVVFTSLLHHDVPFPPLGRFRTGITRTPQVTLDAQILDDGDGLYLSWDVIDDFFRDGVLASMWESYCRFVERLAVDEGAWDDEWRDLLPPEQRRRRIDANATSMAVPRETLHERVLQQARRTPDRVAVVAPDGTMTYAEVVGRASALARELRSAGARPNELVAIVLPKGGAQVVAALGVQLSGAAYLPIDIATPPARIEELLLLGEARFAVAADSVPLSPAVKNIVATGTIDADHDAGPAGPDDLAYVIFTSGSTGTPKGVMIRHSAAANTVRDINQRFGLSADDRTIALSSLSFDLSVWDIFGTLSCGGAIVIPEGDGARDPAYLARLIEEHGVTIWNSVPSYLQLLAEHAPDPRRLRTLRLAMLSGDWIPVSLPGRLPVPIVSLGGATEASIWSIFHSIERVDPTWTSIPYGKPLANQQFYVLDERMEDCPEGVEGELYIGGDGLADGYWRDAARTATSFVVHPQKGRLYRTGDWGRFRPSAEIEFLGRRDGQVKIAGHRVELGEVEATMLRCSGVREAVAVTFNDEHAQKRLAAFYAGGAAAAEVRAQLEALLPAYMVPSRLAPIESMPLSANGKVDRNALAARAAAKQGTALERFFAAPAMLKAPAERRRFVAEGRGVRHDVAGTTSTSLRVSDDLPQRAAAWKSVRDFAGLVTLAQIEALVAGLRAFESEGRVRRAYPSAGETWSVQLYLHVQPSRVEGLQEGVYYYQPLQHELLRLAGAASIDAAMHVPANQKMFGDAAFSLVFIADLDAIRPMYGDHAEAFAWMEAGHMAQILRQTAAEHGLGLCLVGLFDVDPLRRALGLGEGHLAVGSMVGGVPRAVEQPAVVEPRSSSHVPAVADATTEGIAAIWRDVLEIPSVPLDERFFELGGTSFSILAVQRELLARLGREVSITDLFRHSTVAALAEHLRGGSGPGGAAGEEADDLAAKRRLRRTLRQAQAGGAPR